ncbi:MerR family transcriptional regulator [Streptomyces sp. NPDC054784]
MICPKPIYARKAPPPCGAFRVAEGGGRVVEDAPRGKALTTSEAAELAGVKPQTISMWAKRGKLTAAGQDENGRPLYWQVDVARAESATRARARRNVGLRTVATEDIADDEAVLVRLSCGHLKILSIRHAPDTPRPVACFECAAESKVDRIVCSPTTAAA